MHQKKHEHVEISIHYSSVYAINRAPDPSVFEQFLKAGK